MTIVRSKVLVTSFSLAAFAPAFSSAAEPYALPPNDRCPNLTGNYRCIGADHGKDLYFRVELDDGSTVDEAVYRFEYPDLGLRLEVKASPYGRRNQDAEGQPRYWAYCQRGALLYLLENDSTGFLQENSLKGGGYAVKVRGKLLGAPCERTEPGDRRGVQPDRGGGRSRYGKPAPLQPARGVR